MTGSKLSQRIIKHLRTEYKAYVVNVVQAGKSGVPDILACIKGIFFAFEIKGDNDIPSELQKVNIQQIKNSGGFGGFVYCVSDVDTIIKEVIDNK